MEPQTASDKAPAHGTGSLAIISLLSIYLLIPIVAAFAVLEGNSHSLPSEALFTIGILFLIIGLAVISLGIVAGIEAALQASRQPAEPGRGLTRAVLIAAGSLGALVNILIVLSAVIFLAGSLSIF